MISLLAGVLAMPLLAVQATARLERPAGYWDQYRAHLAETDYRFHCGKTQLRLRLAEHFRKREESLPLADRWRIKLVDIAVPGRRIPRAERAKAEALFYSLSWIEHIHSQCTGTGAIWIFFTGMPAQRWADFAEEKIAEKPRTVPYQLTVSATGTVTIQ
jgi:hypothetical protein